MYPLQKRIKSKVLFALCVGATYYHKFTQISVSTNCFEATETSKLRHY
jgi:hypothetical protein